MNRVRASRVPNFVWAILQTILLGVIAALAIHCGSGAAVQSSVERAFAAADPLLLARACTFDASGNVTVQVGANEVAYIGRRGTCSVEPCVLVNALDSNGYPCLVNSSGKSITINGVGGAGAAEKVALDYSHGLFAMATNATPLVNVTLDTQTSSLSSVYVVAPSTGGNIFAGGSGVCLDTRVVGFSGRSAPLVDVHITWSSTGAVRGNLVLDGGLGDDVLTGDLAGWSANLLPNWAATSTILANLGGGYPGQLSVNGWAGDDVLGGGALTSTIDGGTGNDLLRQSLNVRNDIVKGGDGIDTVDYGARTAPLFITLTTSPVSGEVGECDSIDSDVEIVIGGSGDDTIDARWRTLTDAVVFGGAGNDTLIGGGNGASGVVTELCGGSGDDHFKWVAAGSSYLVGGAGADVVDYSSATATTIACLSSTAAACSSQNGPPNTFDVSNSSSVTHVCPRAVLRIPLASGATSTISTTGLPFLNWLPTGAGGSMSSGDVENIIGPVAATSTLVCGDIACVVQAGSGNDTIVGSPQGDIIYGGGSTVGETVTTSGGGDYVDINHMGSISMDANVTCGGSGDNSTIILNAVDTLTTTACGGAVISWR